MKPSYYVAYLLRQIRDTSSLNSNSVRALLWKIQGVLQILDHVAHSYVTHVFLFFDAQYIHRRVSLENFSIFRVKEYVPVTYHGELYADHLVIELPG